VPLYSAVHAALANLYDAHLPAASLDVGCGDGSALLPALRAAAHLPSRVDVVEPSGALLTVATAGLREVADGHRFAGTVQEFLARPELPTWDPVESTFALHTLPRAERDVVLQTLRPRTRRWPSWSSTCPRRRWALPSTWSSWPGRTSGLAEYAEDRELVAQGS